MRALALIMCLSLSPLSACATTPMLVAQNPIAKEALYAGIIKRAEALKGRADAYAAKASPALSADAGFQRFTQEVSDLADLNMQAHLDLKARGTDNDLKCVLKGVSLDLKIKHDALKAAQTPEALKVALTDLSYLLADNIDVIVTPATVDSGLDCIIEFG